MSKIALGIGATGLAVGASVGIANYLNEDKSLSARLVKEGFDVKVNDWTAIFDSYNTGEKDLFKLGEQKTKEALAEKCSEILSQNSASEENYKLAKRWCVKEEAVSDILGRLNLRKLKTDTDDDNQNHWKGIVAKAKDIEEIASKLDVAKGSDDNANIPKIKAKCKEIIEIKTTKEEFNEKLELAKEWCSVKKEEANK